MRRKFGMRVNNWPAPLELTMLLTFWSKKRNFLICFGRKHNVSAADNYFKENQGTSSKVILFFLRRYEPDEHDTTDRCMQLRVQTTCFQR